MEVKFTSPSGLRDSNISVTPVSAVTDVTCPHVEINNTTNRGTNLFKARCNEI